MAWATMAEKVVRSRLNYQDYNRLVGNDQYLYSGFDVGHDPATGAHSIKLSDLAATTSAELAGVISDETGSGSLVFGTSPVFTTKITTPEVASADDLLVTCGANKTLRLASGAWTDLMLFPTEFRLPAASSASWVDAATTGWSTELLSFSKTATNTVYFTMQLPHSYVEGSDISCHVHWTPKASKTVAEGVRVMWELKVRWTNIGAVRGSEITRSNYLPVQHLSGGVYTAADLVAATHHLTTFTAVATGANGGVLAGTGKTLSSVLAGSLSRLGADATYDTYDDEVFLLGFDFHYQCDTLGSRLELEK